MKGFRRLTNGCMTLCSSTSLRAGFWHDNSLTVCYRRRLDEIGHDAVDQCLGICIEEYSDNHSRRQMKIWRWSIFHDLRRMIGQSRSVLETVDIGLSLNSSDIEVARSSLQKSRSTQFILISRTLNKQIQIRTRKNND